MKKLSKNGFTFKRFFIAHDKSPMKVTTDSCLLGAWSRVSEKTQKVLDIGCGCGIIALMLAQRLEKNDSMIDAIDIDLDAVNQCQENINNSPFNHINSLCIDINQYQPNSMAVYDLIVTNPPYFASAVDCRNEQRQQARYTENLNHNQIIAIAKRLLKDDGYFCVVLPYHLSAVFIQQCLQQGLYLSDELCVKYTENKQVSLHLLCFTPQPIKTVISQTLVMRDNEGSYTELFRNLLQDFYLFNNKIKSY